MPPAFTTTGRGYPDAPGAYDQNYDATFAKNINVEH